MWQFYVVVLSMTAVNCSKVRTVRAARFFFVIRPINLLIYGVVVPILVVDAKFNAPCPRRQLPVNQDGKNLTALVAALTFRFK